MVALRLSAAVTCTFPSVKTTRKNRLQWYHAVVPLCKRKLRKRQLPVLRAEVAAFRYAPPWRTGLTRPTHWEGERKGDSGDPWLPLPVGPIARIGSTRCLCRCHHLLTSPPPPASRCYTPRGLLLRRAARRVASCSPSQKKLGEKRKINSNKIK